MENQGELFLVKGCGVSFICKNRAQVLERINEILERGGIPEVMRWSDVGTTR